MECGQLYMYCYFVGLSPFLVVDREFSFFFFFLVSTLSVIPLRIRRGSWALEDCMDMS